MDKASIVIAEHGTDWSSWAAKLQTSETKLVLLMQDEDEAAEAFLRRTHTRLRELSADGVQFKEAAFIGNGTSSARSNKDRSRILRAVSSLLSQAGAKALYLDESMQNASRRSKQMLTALAWALNDLARGSGFSISVTGPEPCPNC